GCSLLGLTSGTLQSEASGIILTLGAGLAYALYAVTSKGILERQHPDAAVGVVFSLGAVMLTPLFFFVDLQWLATGSGVAVALELGLVATAAAYLLYARGLIHIPVATAVTLSLGEPLVATLLAVLLLGERLTAVAWVGIALLFIGLVWLSSGRRRRA
ncbi:MAG: EamA family transporter, partial [Caldilineaceae bacterium]|nr:EamA family transporter [Caldilineaceae bacterium]